MLCTTEDGRVELHPKSVNTKAEGFESNFLVYHLKLKSTKLYIYDSTMVHSLPLLFFGHGLKRYEEEGTTILELSNDARFSMSAETANLIMVIFFCIILFI